MTPQEVIDLREEMDQAVRAYAQALWELQDDLSNDGETNQMILGDWIAIAHFTPTDKMVRDNAGEILPSPMYTLLTPRNMPPHSIEGLLHRGAQLADEDAEITKDLMFPEDGNV